METDDRFWDSQCKAIDDQEKLAARARRTFAQVCHTPFERENHGMELRLIGILATLADLKERATNEHVLQDNTLCHIARAAVDQVNGEDLKLCDWQLLFCPRCREVGMRVDRILTDMAERMARLEDQLNDGIFNLAVTPMETATIDAVGVQETKMKIVMRQIKDVPFIQQNSMIFAERTFQDAKYTLLIDLQKELAKHCNASFDKKVAAATSGLTGNEVREAGGNKVLKDLKAGKVTEEEVKGIYDKRMKEFSHSGQAASRKLEHIVILGRKKSGEGEVIRLGASLTRSSYQCSFQNKNLYWPKTLRDAAERATRTGAEVRVYPGKAALEKPGVKDYNFFAQGFEDPPKQPEPTELQKRQR